ncbi:MAG: D-sedoheptulose 7-phosphate isomerase [Candidatus Omnitrophota bacterium]
MKAFVAKQIEDSLAAQTALLEAGTLKQIQKAAALLTRCLGKRGKILLFGNGGSAADSQHLAAEWVGRFVKERRAMAAIALTTDTSILTAIGNDYGFERVFERQIQALGRRGDVAVAFSTSGNSKNVLLALRAAKKIGMATIGLTGSGGGLMRSAVDVLIAVGGNHTARIQECHGLIGHILCACVEHECS